MKLIKKYQYPNSGIERNDATYVHKEPIVLNLKYLLKPGEYFYKNPRTGKVSVIRRHYAEIRLDNRTESLKVLSLKESLRIRLKRLMQKAEEDAATVVGEVLDRTARPTKVVRLIYDTLNGDGAKSFIEGNNGLVSDEFAKNNPGVTEAVNIIGDFILPWKFYGTANKTTLFLEDGIPPLKGPDGKIFNSQMVYTPRNWYRSIGYPAILDALTSGVVRGIHQWNTPTIGPFFGRGKPANPNAPYIIEGTPESATWVDPFSPTLKQHSVEPVRNDASFLFTNKNGTIDYNKLSTENGFLQEGQTYEGFPLFNGSVNATPTTNFTFYKKYPWLGWRLFKMPTTFTLSTLERQPTTVRTIVDDLGKTRVQLSSHTQEHPREIVIEPSEEGIHNVHIRTWDGDHIPANMSAEDKQLLIDSFINNFPEGHTIAIPQSGLDYLATRGTIRGLKLLERSPLFLLGKEGPILYLDKDGKSVKTYMGHEFTKVPLTKNEISITTPKTIEDLDTTLASLWNDFDSKALELIDQLDQIKPEGVFYDLDYIRWSREDPEAYLLYLLMLQYIKKYRGITDYIELVSKVPDFYEKIVKTNDILKALKLSDFNAEDFYWQNVAKTQKFEDDTMRILNILQNKDPYYKSFLTPVIRKDGLGRTETVHGLRMANPWLIEMANDVVDRANTLGYDLTTPRKIWQFGKDDIVSPLTSIYDNINNPIDIITSKELPAYTIGLSRGNGLVVVRLTPSSTGKKIVSTGIHELVGHATELALEAASKHLKGNSVTLNPYGGVNYTITGTGIERLKQMPILEAYGEVSLLVNGLPELNASASKDYGELRATLLLLRAQLYKELAKSKGLTLKYTGENLIPKLKPEFDLLIDNMSAEEFGEKLAEINDYGKDYKNLLAGLNLSVNPNEVLQKLKDLTKWAPMVFIPLGINLTQNKITR